MTKRESLITFLLVFMPAFALYLATLAPSITWAHQGADGGDLISAAITNGVAHPPGYPTYVTLGQLFARLPIGAVAYRFNMMSAACMALAAALTSLGILRAFPSSVEVVSQARQARLGVAILAGLFFATAPMVWGQATIAEVHGLNALFVAAIVYLVAPIVLRSTAIPNYQLMLAAFLWGSGLGNSLTIAALAPMVIVALWRSDLRSRWLAVIAFFIGLSVYLLIPLRAALQPPINWGNAVTWQNFVAHVSAELYHGYTLGVPPGEYPARLVALAQLTVEQFGWLGVILGVIGVREILISPNKNWRWPALSIGLYLLFALSYNTSDSDLYLIPVWMFGAWAIARGIWHLLNWIQVRLDKQQKLGDAGRFIRHSSSSILIAILICGPLLQAAAYYSAMDLHADHVAEIFARTVLSAAPPHAIVVTGNDAQTFTLWYYRLVMRQRSDIAIVDARMVGYPWYESMLRNQGDAPQLPDYDPQATWQSRLSEQNAARAVCAVTEISFQLLCR